ncbi:MAG: hypothetical protein PHQ27_07675 [Victivallales bacterium]|nr:hypothetical protein [Victivallales bacterium]
MNHSLKYLSQEYERRFAAADFRSVAEFKTAFFRRARNFPLPAPRRHFRHVYCTAAAAAMLLFGLGFGIFLFHRPITTSDTTLLAEARRLFEPDNLGISLVNSELYTFDRNSRQKAGWLFELNLTPVGPGKPVKIQFTAANGESVKIDTPLFKGEFWVYRIDKNLFALESNCRVRTPNGREFKMNEFGPLPINTAQTEKSARYIITRKVVML